MNPAAAAAPATPWLRAWSLGLGLALLLCLPLAEWMRPTRSTASVSGAIDLARQVPMQFAQWRVDPQWQPVMPDPQMQATLDSAYSQVLGRTYIDTQGRRVMLSIAYGSDQNSEATAVHRPEFCYRAQGFAVDELGPAEQRLGPHGLRQQRLVGRIGPRVEPISYWITLDQQSTLPGLGRKLQQWHYGLRGWVADGMVVRVSTIGPPDEANFALQQAFVAQWHAAMPAPLRARYFGGGQIP